METSNERDEFDLDVRMVAHASESTSMVTCQGMSCLTVSACGTICSCGGTCDTCDYCTRNYPRCGPEE